MRHQRKHLYSFPWIWVLIFGLVNADGRTDSTDNFDIFTEMDLNGETKTNSTDVEISSDEIDYEYGEYNGEVNHRVTYVDDVYFFVPEEPEESIDEEFEVSTIITLALVASILFIVGTIGAGCCSSRPPLRSETPISMSLSLSEPRTEGVISENQPLFDAVSDDNQVQNQNNAGGTSVQQV